MFAHSCRRQPEHRLRELVRALSAVLVVALACAGCGGLGLDRTAVRPDQARSVLQRAITLTSGPNPAAVCTLSPSEASTCPDTIVDLADLQPDSDPEVLCIVPAPSSGPLRGGQVVVLRGEDAAGEPYVTDFVVYDAGESIGVLDAVWWSGLTVVSYRADQVEWEFASSSTACERGGLPTEGPTS